MQISKQLSSPRQYLSTGRCQKLIKMQHNKDQDALGSCVSYVQDLRSEYCDVRKRKTRRIPKDDEELQYCNLPDRKYNRIQKNQLNTYATTWRIPTWILKYGNPSHRHDKCPSNVHQGGFTHVFFQLTPLPSRSARWDAPCVNLEISLWEYFPQEWWN